MKKSTKAVLLSLLVFPGTGHFISRQWRWGLLFMSITLLASGILIVHGFNKASDIMDRALSGEIPLEPETIELLIREAPPPDVARILIASQWLLLTCWLGGAAHAYLKAGSGQDETNNPTPKKENAEI